MGNLKGVYDFRDRRKKSTSNNRKRKYSLPEYWGIDLVMILICLTATIFSLVYRKEIMVCIGKLLVNVIPIVIALIIIVLVIVILFGIRNKRSW